jgi:hypothetical protein
MRCASSCLAGGGGASATLAAMRKRPSGQQQSSTHSWAVYGKHSWAIYRIKGTKFVGLIHDQPDGDSAIKAAIVEYNVPPNERGRLMAQRRD